MAESTKKVFSVNWKDAIWLIMLVVGMSSSFFTTRSKVEMLESQVQENSQLLHDNNLELINYKLDKVQESQNEFKTSFNKFLDAYYNSN